MRRIQTLFVVTFLLVAAAGGGLGLGAVSAAANDDAGAGNEDGAAGNEPVDDPANETDAFGQLVSDFVHALQADNDTDGPFGIQVANFVLDNNPAADMIPDHAGPPDNLTVGPPENRTTGPPANVSTGPPDNATGPPDNVTRGPPADAGAAGNGTAGGPDNERGPPDDRGPEATDDERGPPADAGPPDH